MGLKKLSVLKEFSKYIGDYLLRLPVFEELNKRFHIEKVLYPGSYCDVVPSLVFSNVVYVDSYKKVDKFFKDKSIKDYVYNHKHYTKKPNIKFYLSDYSSRISELKNDFNLLISLSAGYISISCKKYLKKGGIFLVNNDHYDATRACLKKDYQLIGVFDLLDESYIYSQNNLNDYFKLKSGEKLNLEKLNSLASKPPSKSLKKFFKNSDLYVFKKMT